MNGLIKLSERYINLKLVCVMILAIAFVGIIPLPLSIPSASYVQTATATTSIAIGSYSHAVISPAIDITRDSHFPIHSTSGSGSADDPWIIENLEISFTAASIFDRGISIVGTTEHFIIQNSTIKEVGSPQRGIGIYIWNVTAGTTNIVNNTVESAAIGIKLENAPSSNISRNIVLQTRYTGISLVSSMFSTISENQVLATGVGVDLFDSSSTHISKNSIHNNSDFGVFVILSDLIKIRGNLITNSRYGIYFLNLTSQSLIECNNLQFNGEYGVFIGYVSDNNMIHHNTLLGNNFTGDIQAFDAGTNNIWYDTTILEGNYWSDWSESSVYPIDGPAGSVDPIPLQDPINIEVCLCECVCVQEPVPVNGQTSGFLGVLVTMPILFLTHLRRKRRKKFS